MSPGPGMPRGENDTQKILSDCREMEMKQDKRIGGEEGWQMRNGEINGDTLGGVS